MTGKERANLRKIAQTYDCVLYVGKEGITESLAESARQAIEARELIKCSVQQNCDFTAREACDALCEILDAEGISCVGRKFVLYKRSEKNILGL